MTEEGEPPILHFLYRPRACRIRDGGSMAPREEERCPPVMDKSSRELPILDQERERSGKGISRKVGGCAGFSGFDMNPRTFCT